MEREFTNALSQTPLWQFALQVYPKHQAILLHWQDSLGASVNDLLLLAYAKKNEFSVQPFWWQQRYFNITRPLLLRIRQLRRARQGHVDYEHSKQLELAVEGLDILMLQACLVAEKSALPNCLSQYEKHLGIKKGALAPFLITLLT
jgi:hypothetical protein